MTSSSEQEVTTTHAHARLLLTVYFSSPALSVLDRAEVRRAEGARDAVTERADTAAVDTSDRFDTLRGVPAVKKSPEMRHEKSDRLLTGQQSIFETSHIKNTLTERERKEGTSPSLVDNTKI